MKIVNSIQMRGLDLAAIQKYGIPALDLMEAAGRGVADAVTEVAGSRQGPVVIVAGRGNNGGDGLVAARHLISRGRDVSVILLAGAGDLSPDARANLEFLAPLTTHIYFAPDVPTFNSIMPMLANAVCIVDAIFGTGLDREVSGLPLLAISAINAQKCFVVAVDVPSGLSADTGLAPNGAVAADVTATFGLPKIGLFIKRGPECAGSVKVVDIGIPCEEVKKINEVAYLIGPPLFDSCFLKRPAPAHKGDFGHVVIFAGSRAHMGAGYLAALGALRSGAGLATYCLPEKAFAKFDARYPEIMCDLIPDAGTAAFNPAGLDAALKISEGKSCVAVGPAIGTSNETREFINTFIKKSGVPLVIDADGLNVLDAASLKNRRAATILTPHPGEMARLIGKDTEYVQADRLNIAKEFASRNNVYLILKGHYTLVATPGGQIFINPTGNPGMATAGMGDALTGIVASFIAQGFDVKTACIAAVYIHGMAGDIAASELGERALITSDVIKHLSGVIKRFEVVR